MKSASPETRFSVLRPCSSALFLASFFPTKAVNGSMRNGVESFRWGR